MDDKFIFFFTQFIAGYDDRDQFTQSVAYCVVHLFIKRDNAFRFDSFESFE